MKGFKPTGFGPSAGFKFPSKMGFTGSTGNFTSVSPYTRRIRPPRAPKAFAEGGFVREDSPRMKTEVIGDQGSALQRRAKSYSALDQESGGKSPIRPYFKDGGKWIAGATKNKGALHRALGVPEGKKIPAKKMAKAAHSSNPTMRKRAALAKTLGKMHKADGGPVDDAAKRKATDEAIRRNRLESMDEAGMLSEADRAALQKMRAAEKSPVKKADGGEISRRTNAYSFKQSLRAIPGLINEAPELIKDAMARQRLKRPRQINRQVAGASGDDLRTDYQMGGLAGMAGMRGPQRMQAPPVGSGRRIGIQPMPMGGVPMGVAPMRGAPMPMGRAMMMRAKGGAAHSDIAQDRPMMKKVAQEAIGEHVRYPAPKGHKGMDKLVAKRR